jgi:hypothetical protein
MCPRFGTVRSLTAASRSLERRGDVPGHQCRRVTRRGRRPRHQGSALPPTAARALQLQCEAATPRRSSHLVERLLDARAEDRLPRLRPKTDSFPHFSHQDSGFRGAVELPSERRQKNTDVTRFASPEKNGRGVHGERLPRRIYPLRELRKSSPLLSTRRPASADRSSSRSLASHRDPGNAHATGLGLLVSGAGIGHAGTGHRHREPSRPGACAGLRLPTAMPSLAVRGASARLARCARWPRTASTRMRTTFSDGTGRPRSGRRGPIALLTFRRAARVGSRPTR